MVSWWLTIIPIMAIIIRFIQVLPNRIKYSSWKNTNKTTDSERRNEKKIKTLVVLGSGGHTGEMMDMIQALDPNKYSFEFVVAQTDTNTEAFVRNLLKNKTEYHPLSFHYIPRSREVHQSYFTSIFTTIRAFIYTTLITNTTINPDLVSDILKIIFNLIMKIR